MSYSSSISISARHASDLCGVIHLAPSMWGTSPSSSSISCSTKLQQPISALCFENTSAFRFNVRIRPFFKSIITSKFLTKSLRKMNWSASSKFSTTRKLIHRSRPPCGKLLSAFFRLRKLRLDWRRSVGGSSELDLPS